MASQALKFADQFLSGPGSWVFGIKARELLISQRFDVEAQDNVVKKLAKTAFNTALRLSTFNLSSFLPAPLNKMRIFSYIGFPYCERYGVISNIALAGVKGCIGKYKESAIHLGFAALDFASLYVNPLVNIGAGLIYSAAGAVADLKQITKKIHGRMFPPVTSESEIETRVYTTIGKDGRLSTKISRHRPSDTIEIPVPEHKKDSEGVIKKVSDIVHSIGATIGAKLSHIRDRMFSDDVVYIKTIKTNPVANPPASSSAPRKPKSGQKAYSDFCECTGSAYDPEEVERHRRVLLSATIKKEN